MHLPTLLKTMCSLIESKSVKAIFGTQTQEVENLLATALIIAEPETRKLLLKNIKELNRQV